MFNRPAVVPIAPGRPKKPVVLPRPKPGLREFDWLTLNSNSSLINQISNPRATNKVSKGSKAQYNNTVPKISAQSTITLHNNTPSISFSPPPPATRNQRAEKSRTRQPHHIQKPIESFFPVTDASSFPVADASATPVTDASFFPFVDASAPPVPDASVFPVTDALLLPVQPQPVQNPSFVDGISLVFIMKQQPTGLGSKHKTAERATNGKEQKSLGGSPEEVHDRSSDEDDYKSLTGGDELKHDGSDGEEEFLAEEDRSSSGEEEFLAEEDGELQDQEVLAVEDGELQDEDGELQDEEAALAEEDRDKEGADHEGLRGSYSGNSNNVGALEKRALFNAVLGQPGLLSNGNKYGTVLRQKIYSVLAILLPTA
ncbi:MAG: hypothetical protein L6R38_002583 [Xanthoria sp. 2 TBL-2021]|nr:MAG: hypothetical protein L6R38_002583 [Xanthoria sp. 2 TBL-2021]